MNWLIVKPIERMVEGSDQGKVNRLSNHCRN